MHEQIVWERALQDLASQFGITMSYVSTWPNDTKPSAELPVESEARTCFKNHLDEGFEDQHLYIWEGHYKGKLGRMMQMNGDHCKVGLEDAVVTVNVIVIEGRHLIA